MLDRNVLTRIGFAAVAIPLALGVVWLGGWALVAVVALVAALGVRELFDLAARHEVHPARTLGIATAALLPAVVWLVDAGTAAEGLVAVWWPYTAAVWLIGLLCWALLARGPSAKPLAAVSVTAFAVLYAGALPAFLVDIRHAAHGLRSWQGTWLVFFPLVTIWICDTAAMFGGRAIGGAKLAPTVSPGKTRSGAIAGVLGGLAVAPLFQAAFLRPVGLAVPLWQLLAIAGVISVLGQAGDLAESLFKREAGVKDSSTLIPGHGGVLDRFDSLYVAIPLAAAGYRLCGILG